MDQEHQCFEVVWCQARDVRPEDLGALIAGLGAWKDATASAAQLLLAQQEGCRLKAEVREPALCKPASQILRQSTQGPVSVESRFTVETTGIPV